MDKRICGSLLNIVFITREILSPLHQLLLISSLGRHHLASIVDRCHLHLLLDVVLETGVAQLLVVGQTRPVVVPGQDKLQNKLKLVFP